MNNHFIIYESANYDSFAHQILEGAFSSEQLSEQIKNSSAEQLKIIEENIKYCGKYKELIDSKIIEEAWFGLGTPNQRGKTRALWDKAAGKMGGVKAQTRNKLIEVYQKVWKEFNNYLKKQSALGNDQAATFASLQKFLNHVGLDAALIGNTFTNGEFASVDQTLVQDKNALAKFVFQVLQAYYQGGKPQVGYRPPSQI